MSKNLLVMLPESRESALSFVEKKIKENPDRNKEDMLVIMPKENMKTIDALKQNRDFELKTTEGGFLYEGQFADVQKLVASLTEGNRLNPQAMAEYIKSLIEQKKPFWIFTESWEKENPGVRSEYPAVCFPDELIEKGYFGFRENEKEYLLKNGKMLICTGAKETQDVLNTLPEATIVRDDFGVSDPHNKKQIH